MSAKTPTIKTDYLPVVLLLLFATIFNGCSPVLYSPVGQNVPMFTEKGEAALNLGYAETYGNETTGKGISLQAAYALTKNLAMMGSFYSMSEKEEQGYYLGQAASEWNTKGSYYELGMGTYFVNPSKTLAYEVFGGLGGGSIKNSYIDGGDNVEVSILKPFIQPSVGYISKYVDVIATPRIGMVIYTSHKPDDPLFAEFMADHDNTFVFEPGVTVRAGVKNVKVQFQYNYSTFKAETETLDYGSVSLSNKEFISVGLYVLISNRYKQVSISE